jgi:hypothetical protein
MEIVRYLDAETDWSTNTLWTLPVASLQVTNEEVVGIGMAEGHVGSAKNH